jgi:hypothetical protein
VLAQNGGQSAEAPVAALVELIDDISDSIHRRSSIHSLVCDGFYSFLLADASEGS